MARSAIPLPATASRSTWRAPTPAAAPYARIDPDDLDALVAYSRTLMPVK